MLLGDENEAVEFGPPAVEIRNDRLSVVRTLPPLLAAVVSNCWRLTASWRVCCAALRCVCNCVGVVATSFTLVLVNWLSGVTATRGAVARPPERAA
ncbi:MAG: hypothetical protein EXR98_00905 [Gemmataceae bacterium]|nr:hypothetical protein [Gemmataceae bacterium]